MKKSTKYMITTAAATVMLLGCAGVSYAAGSNASNKTGWEEITVEEDRQQVKKWVYYQDGKMVKSDWVCSPASGLWYYMNSDGYMITDCWGDERKSDGYWFDANGVMATGWRLIDLDKDEEESYYGPGSSSSEDEKGYFYFNSSGKVCDGWLNLNGTYYYLNDGYVDGYEDYQMVYGQVEIDDKEYYFGESTDGSMKKGIVKITEKQESNFPGASSTESYQLYDDKGAKVTEGWGKYNGEWYYVNDKGELVTDGFLYLDSDDDMVDSAENAKNVYYMDEKGVMMKGGWLELGEEKEVSPGEIRGKSYYYFKSSGVMQTGWLRDGKTYYYLSETETDGYSVGEMVTGLWEINGKSYFFAKDGKMSSSSWESVEDDTGEERTIYLDANGALLKADKGDGYALYTISKKYYFFDEDGYLADEKGTVFVQSGSKWVIKSELELADDEVYYKLKSKGVAEKKRR